VAHGIEQVISLANANPLLQDMLTLVELHVNVFRPHAFGIPVSFMKKPLIAVMHLL
jgi:hypothetical protein